MLIWSDKAVAEEEKFGVDWTRYLVAGDTIVSTSVDAPGGLVADRLDHVGPLQTLWLAAGEPGTHIVVCGIVTASGQTPLEKVEITITP